MSTSTAMPHRRYRFRRSQSEVTQEERSYRRAASFLRDFHRSQSLDVILEEGGNSQENAPAQPMMMLPKKKSACFCLADLAAAAAAAAAAADEMDDGSTSSCNSRREEEEEDGDGDKEEVRGEVNQNRQRQPYSSRSSRQLLYSYTHQGPISGRGRGLGHAS
jgi:hypothetical protein